MTEKIDYELRIISRQVCCIRDVLAYEKTPDKYLRALTRMNTIMTAARHLEEALAEENEKGGGSDGKNGTAESTDRPETV